jgi:Tfp pilus assembly protein PilE
LCRRKGLTLVEVVASLLLLACLLTGILTAYANHARQIRRAQLRLRAVTIADRMLTGWIRTSTAIPENSSGTVPDDATLKWQTRTVDGPESHEAMGIHVVRLEILGATRAQEPEKNDPLVVVDLAAPAPERETEPPKDEKKTVE